MWNIALQGHRAKHNSRQQHRSKCGSCRAPARLRRRRHNQPLQRLNHRFRSLAKARQLPQGIGGVCGISVCRASAPNTTPDNNTAQNVGAGEPQRGCEGGGTINHLHRLIHRFRSLAEARQLPQGIGGVCGMSLCSATAPNTAPYNNTAQNVGAVEPQRGCEGGGTINLFSA